MNALSYALLCLIWGSTWLGIKIGLDGGMPPLLGVALRFVIAGLLVLPLALLRHRAVFRDAKAWRLAVFVGVLNFGFGFGLTYIGGGLVPSGLGSLTFGVFPLWVALLSHMKLGDRLTPGKLGGLALGLVGLVVLFWGSLLQLGRDSVLGIALILASVLVQGIGQIYAKRDGAAIPSAFISSIGMLVGSGVLALAGVAFGEAAQPFPLTLPVLGSIAYLAVFGSIVTFLTYYRLLKQLSATLMAMIALITPPIAVVLGLVFKGEKLGSVTLLGGSMVLLGILYFHLAERHAR